MRVALFALMMFLVSAALVGGFLIVGGPQHGRNEQQDMQRLQDLRGLSRYLSCRRSGTKLPVDLDQEGYCNKFRPLSVSDPQSGLPYVYRLLDDNRFEVCAVFKAANVRQRRYTYLDGLRFNGQEGCLTGRGSLISNGQDGVPSDKG